MHPCTCLLYTSDLLLLDEPFSALDYQTRLNVCDDIGKIIKKEGKTAILVTHDISEAISMADRVIVLEMCIRDRDNSAFVERNTRNALGFPNPSFG